MLPFWYKEQIKKEKESKEKFIQEYLYVEDFPLNSYTEDANPEKKDETKRGIVIFEF